MLLRCAVFGASPGSSFSAARSPGAQAAQREPRASAKAARNLWKEGTLAGFFEDEVGVKEIRLRDSRESMRRAIEAREALVEIPRDSRRVTRALLQLSSAAGMPRPDRQSLMALEALVKKKILAPRLRLTDEQVLLGHPHVCKKTYEKTRRRMTQVLPWIGLPGGEPGWDAKPMRQRRRKQSAVTYIGNEHVWITFIEEQLRWTGAARILMRIGKTRTMA